MRVPPTVQLVLFGGGGDLAHRKLVPALYDLHREGHLPAEVDVVGVDMAEMDDGGFASFACDAATSLGRFFPKDAANQDWDAFEERLAYVQGDVTQAETFERLRERLDALAPDGEAPHRVFYLSVAPFLVEPIVRGLTEAHLLDDIVRSRIVIEKPFGHDLESARALDRTLTETIDESQVYRIDHYLGKETVQNMLAFRFANVLFEPIWDARYVDHVQITVAETVGVEHRGGYYEGAGALRDMVQNHLLQLLCLVAMEPPVAFQADEVRNKKVDVLRAVRPIAPDRVHEVAVRGQYGSGFLGGAEVPAYRAEPNVDPHSTTETYAALKLEVDNWRWHGVPFYLRTGKRMPRRVSEVSVQFRPVPHRAFPAGADEAWQPNRLVIRIQPDEGIVLRFQAKRPGPSMLLHPVAMRFDYDDAFETPPEAYETLLLDAIRGDATLFMRADQVETAWEVVQPVLDAWADSPPAEFPNYASGTWGPAAADRMLAHDGRSWFEPLPPDPTPAGMAPEAAADARPASVAQEG
ncbi:glucose-6-phosphate dehydrogenase [Rubrivirga litoralis]|uniref:Glucose-6-phosphate 1-dehydrogenase n=1 Tax=Rubrivirga litoralis TaxID=3075598 RepID=A0ABU3BR09_9BACT|nr:glucose-6-phosphate dehydrogenase [Rubrivirga sp. F394]MDT0631722.1 glucose-6-phosphate dehydrogenase [Rubrivirga sp. F394]